MSMLASMREALGAKAAQAKAGYQAGKALSDAKLGTHKGQMGGGLVRSVIGLVVLVIVVVGVGIPITNDVIASQNLTGITATIVGFVPVAMALVALIAVFGAVLRRQ